MKALGRPNLDDQQIAYAIWIELSTREIGLPIDPDLNNRKKALEYSAVEILDWFSRVF